MFQALDDKETTTHWLRQMQEDTSALVGDLKDAEGGAAAPEVKAMPEPSTTTDAETHAKAGAEALARLPVSPIARCQARRMDTG